MYARFSSITGEWPVSDNEEAHRYSFGAKCGATFILAVAAIILTVVFASDSDHYPSAPNASQTDFFNAKLSNASNASTSFAPRAF